MVDFHYFMVFQKKTYFEKKKSVDEKFIFQQKNCVWRLISSRYDIK